MTLWSVSIGVLHNIVRCKRYMTQRFPLTNTLLLFSDKKMIIILHCTGSQWQYLINLGAKLRYHLPMQCKNSVHDNNKETSNLHFTCIFKRNAPMTGGSPHYEKVMPNAFAGHSVIMCNQEFRKQFKNTQIHDTIMYHMTPSILLFHSMD